MEPYFQFELSMLAYERTPSRRLSAIVDLCCYRMGEHVREQLENGEMEGDVDERLAKFKNPPQEFDIDNDDHVHLGLGMMALNVIGGNAPSMINAALDAEKYLAGMERRFGKFPKVRLRSDLLWDAYKGELSWRDTSVLCAVYSVIGANDKPIRITRDMIVARSMGYKRMADMTPEELAKRADKASPLTISQVRSAQDRMEARKLFSKAQVSRRTTVFSHRMNREELKTAAIKVYGRPNAVKANRADDQKLMKTIKRERAAYHSGENDSSDANPTHGRQTVAIGVATGIATGVATIIETTDRSLSRETCYRPAGGRRHTLSVKDSKIKKLRTLITQATAIGTPEATKTAEAYERQLAQLEAAS